MELKDKQPFGANLLLTRAGPGKSWLEYFPKQAVFCQGDAADAIFYIQKGKVKLTVVSKGGKDAIIAMLSVGDFFGEGCLIGQVVRIATASAVSKCLVLRLEKSAALALLHGDSNFNRQFVTHLLSRNIHIEDELVHQLFNSSEKKLARLLLLLSNFGKESEPEPVIAKISQQTLAEMIGTTRSRVSFFMNKFRRLGLIRYDSKVLEIHKSLLNVVLHAENFESELRTEPALRPSAESRAPS